MAMFKRLKSAVETQVRHNPPNGPRSTRIPHSCETSRLPSALDLHPVVRSRDSRLRKFAVSTAAFGPSRRSVGAP